MAGLLTLVISFLARIAGLGRISDAVMGIIRRIRQPDNFWSTEEFRTYFKKNNLALAISYPSWTTNHPAEWLEIASYGLTTSPSDNMVVIAFDKVSFYLTDPAYKQELLDKLHQWQKTLPQGTYLKINEP